MRNWIAAAAVLVAGTVPVLAHGEKGHAAPQGAAKPPNPLSILSRAHAVARIEVDARAGYRYIRADGLPDHATGQFPGPGNPNTIRAQNYTLRVPLAPRKNAAPTPWAFQPTGIALNGVVFEPGTAEFWNNDPRSGWNQEAIGGPRSLGLDSNNAHVQPDGTYHYHGIPVGLMARLAQSQTPTLLGYAADGFPIYGPFGYVDPAQAAGPIKKLEPSWRLKAGARPANGPPGNYNGYYTQDFEHVPGSGDLDSCNGREAATPEYPQGTYHYVATDRFPFLPRCLMGTADQSFVLKRGPGPGGFGGPPGSGPLGGGPPGFGPPGFGRPPPR